MHRVRRLLDFSRMKDEKRSSQTKPEYRQEPPKRPEQEHEQDAARNRRTPDTEPPKDRREDDL